MHRNPRRRLAALLAVATLWTLSLATVAGAMPADPGALETSGMAALQANGSDSDSDSDNSGSSGSGRDDPRAFDCDSSGPGPGLPCIEVVTTCDDTVIVSTPHGLDEVTIHRADGSVEVIDDYGKHGTRRPTEVTFPNPPDNRIVQLVVQAHIGGPRSNDTVTFDIDEPTCPAPLTPPPPAVDPPADPQPDVVAPPDSGAPRIQDPPADLTPLPPAPAPDPEEPGAPAPPAPDQPGPEEPAAPAPDVQPDVEEPAPAPDAEEPEEPEVLGQRVEREPTPQVTGRDLPRTGSGGIAIGLGLLAAAGILAGIRRRSMGSS